MNFRKGILALAIGGLGLTGIASAQITCTAAPTASPAFIHAEGTTEIIPQVTVGGCTVGAVPTSVSISVTSNAIVNNLPNASGSAATDATATFFGGTTNVQGVLVGNALVFTTALSTDLGTTYTDGIVVNNIRVNASTIPPNTAVTVTVQGTSGLITSTPTSGTVAYTQTSLAKPIVAGFANQAICSAGSSIVPVLEAEITTGFSNAFQASANTAGATNAPVLYLQVNFGGLVSGVNYYVPAVITNGTATNLLNVTTATNITSGANPPTAATGVKIGPSGAQLDGMVQLAVTSGSASALYNLTGLTAGPQGVVIPVFAVTTSGATAGTSSPPTVSAQLVGPTSGYDQFSTTQSPTAVAAVNNAAGITGLALPGLNLGGTYVLEPTTGANANQPVMPTDTGELTSCATTLLFPYILNTGGYDTGIALTNASAGSTVAQNGTCSMQFYGNGAPSTNPYVTTAVAPGSVDTFTVSSVAAGFQGYAIATCNFQNAHGFAFITDGYGQPGQGLSQGYLAIITQANGFSNPNASF